MWYGESCVTLLQSLRCVMLYGTMSFLASSSKHFSTQLDGFGQISQMLTWHEWTVLSEQLTDLSQQKRKRFISSQQNLKCIFVYLCSSGVHSVCSAVKWEFSEQELSFPLVVKCFLVSFTSYTICWLHLNIAHDSRMLLIYSTWMLYLFCPFNCCNSACCYDGNININYKSGFILLLLLL